LSALARRAHRVLPNALGALTGRPLGGTPSFVSWVVTERCPVGCRHCDLGSDTATPRPELTRIERADLARGLAELPLWGVSFVGGEPAILPDLGDLAATFARAGKFVSVATSGVGLERHLDAMIAAPVAAIVWSLDAVTPALHDELRALPGLHDRAVGQIELVLGHTRRPRVAVRFTIQRGNVHELVPFVARWHGMADAVLLQIVQRNGLHTPRDRAVEFRPEDRPALTDAIAQVAEIWPDLAGPALDLMPRYVYEPTALHRDLGFRCLAVPATQLVVLPDGGVRVCWGRADSQLPGDVRRDRLDTIWRSDALQQVRQRMQARDYGCMCWEAANAGNLDLLGPRAWLEAIMPASKR
jgi:MoaA/NifB/PqqE/SkfB family radical SAM enzyme